MNYAVSMPYNSYCQFGYLRQSLKITSSGLRGLCWANFCIDIHFWRKHIGMDLVFCSIYEGNIVIGAMSQTNSKTMTPPSLSLLATEEPSYIIVTYQVYVRYLTYLISKMNPRKISSPLTWARMASSIASARCLASFWAGVSSFPCAWTKESPNESRSQGCSTINKRIIPKDAAPPRCAIVNYCQILGFKNE